MKIKNIISDLLVTIPNIIKHGNLNEEILLKLKEETLLYDYIEVVTDYYDDKDQLGLNNWTDVEGMGYGWRWLKHKEHEWRKMMNEIVVEKYEYLSNHINACYYIVYENNLEKIKVYHFICSNDDYTRTDTIITISNEELFY